MGYNGTVGAMSDIDDWSEMDLREDVDYVGSTATVRDGLITSVYVASVPELDASKFEYTGSNTSFLPNKLQLVTGGFITMSARLDFKDQYVNRVKDVKIIVNIPDGCEFVPNSVVVGTKSLPHSLNGHKLTITLSKEEIDARIRFCMIPVQSGTFMISASTEFDCGGIKNQPIGQIQFEATNGELYVPSVTKTSTVNIGGIGIPKADVEIYDNEKLIGVTKSLANGKWTYSCELSNAYNLSSHEIYVKYRGEGNIMGKTQSKICFYDINAMYWPDYPDFTFIIDMSENDTTKVSDVALYVYTTDGAKRRLPAIYDEQLGKFVASSSFDMYSLPVNVSVDVKYINYNICDSMYQKDALNQQFANYDVVVLEEWNNSMMYKLMSHTIDFSILCVFLQLPNEEESILRAINANLKYEEISTSSTNSYYMSESGAVQIVSYEDDSLLVFATFDLADSVSCMDFWYAIQHKKSNIRGKQNVRKAFYYDPYANETPKSTDKLNQWRDQIISGAIEAANQRLKCADDYDKIAINTAIKDLRQCVGFSIGSFLTYTFDIYA